MSTTRYAALLPVLSICLALAACHEDPRPAGVSVSSLPTDSAPARAGRGELTLLTYNVAGLPWGLSRSDPDRNTPLISPMLNHFDLVLIQEDFAYTATLTSRALHRFRTLVRPTVFTDGLTLLSSHTVAGLTRHMWKECFGVLVHGSDCVAPKGYSVARVTLAPGVVLDLYNVHMDSGRGAGDHIARLMQARQLLQTLGSRSAGRAAIIAGDFNLNVAAANDRALLGQLLGQGGLLDACRDVGCQDERLDRVLLRGSRTVRLEVLSWAVDPRFVDARGRDLSDHRPVAVRLAWARKHRPVAP